MAQGGQSSHSGEKYRVLLIGKTGNGKSALGNTLLGDGMFQSRPGMNSATKVCSTKSATINNVDLEVIDTPGLTDTHHSDEFVRQEISKCLATLSPGPHVVFMVCSCKNRFTKEEYQAYRKARQLLEDSDKKLVAYMVVVFTGLDVLDEANEKVENQIQNGPPELNTMLEEICNGYTFVDNMAKCEEGRNEQRSKLINTIRNVIRGNKNQYFTSDLQNEITEDIKHAAESKAKEEGKSKEQATKEIKEEIMKVQTPQSEKPAVLEKAEKKVQERAKKKGLAGKEGEKKKGFCSVL